MRAGCSPKGRAEGTIKTVRCPVGLPTEGEKWAKTVQGALRPESVKVDVQPVCLNVDILIVRKM